MRFMRIYLKSSESVEIFNFSVQLIKWNFIFVYEAVINVFLNEPMIYFKETALKELEC